MEEAHELGDAYAAGEAHFQEHDFAEAYECFKKAGEMYPEKSAIVVAMSLCKLHLGEVETAKEIAQQGLMKIPMEPSIQNTMGIIALQEKEHEQAIASFERAVAFGDKSDEGIKNLVIALSRVGRYHEALEHLKKQIERSNTPSLMMLAADVAFSCGDNQSAISFSLQVLEADPESIKSLLTIADGYLKLEIYTESARHYLQAFSKNQNLYRDPAYLAKLRKACSKLLPKRHLNRLEDGAYLNALKCGIESLVTSETISIENDAGIGIASTMALKAGAKKSYICEYDPLLQEKIRRMMAVHGIEGEAVFVEGFSIEKKTQELFKEKADLFLHDSLEDGWFKKGALESLIHAKGELLKPEGALFPNQIRFKCRLVAAEAFYASHRLPLLEGWNLEPLFDFTPSHLAIEAREAVKFTPLSDDIELTTFTFDTDIQDQDLIQTTLNPITNGVCYGVVIWPEIVIGDCVISHAPEENSKRACGIQLLDHPLNLEVGKEVQMAFRYLKETYAFSIYNN